MSARTTKVSNLPWKRSWVPRQSLLFNSFQKKTVTRSFAALLAEGEQGSCSFAYFQKNKLKRQPVSQLAPASVCQPVTSHCHIFLPSPPSNYPKPFSCHLGPHPYCPHSSHLLHPLIPLLCHFLQTFLVLPPSSWSFAFSRLCSKRVSHSCEAFLQAIFDVS